MWVRGLKLMNMMKTVNLCVAPYVGAWIETRLSALLRYGKTSHPMWVRGLKPCGTCDECVRQRVAPYVGAWIETLIISIRDNSLSVAPYVGAWIET